MNNNPNNWQVLSQQLHNELNVIKRDALVPYVIAVEDGIENTRDLYEQLLIDVDMSSCGTTSRIEEAIAAIQLYFHRYFVNLEELSLKGGGNGETEKRVKEELKKWWKWMKNYRVWEANRKVFLYPENYIRPELRESKTPAFKTLEEDLLQGEVNTASVQRVYKKYLDEYTEVSRLTIAGGYVYNVPSSDGKRLVLFGRTKTDPRRFYYRLAEFDQKKGSWHPWLPVNVQIDADKVYPVFAFKRVFVFWTTVEAVVDTETSTAITLKQEGDTQTIASDSGSQSTYRIKILYSFYNLNKEWTQPQTLTTEIKSFGKIENVQLSVANSERLRIQEEEDKEHENIVINCTYNLRFSYKVLETEFNHVFSQAQAFSLTPELYTKRVRNDSQKFDHDENGKAVFNALFDEPDIKAEDVVVFNAAEESSEGSWFSFDHKGGSFLCKPDVSPLGDEHSPKSRASDVDELPSEGNIDAAFQVGQVGDEKTYFFDNAQQNYITVSSAETTENKTQYRWGKTRNRMTETGIVDAALVDGDKIYLFSGNEYVVYTKGDELADADSPKRLKGNLEGFPEWDKIDAAFKGTDGKRYFFNQTRQEFIESSDLNTSRAITAKWGKVRNSFTAQDYPINGSSNENEPSVDAAFVWEEYTYLFNKDQYIKYVGSDYQFVEDGYPKESRLYYLLEDLGCKNNNLLYRNECVVAAFELGSTVYLLAANKQNGRRKNYSFSNGTISEADSQDAWTGAFVIGDVEYRFNINALSVSNGTETQPVSLNRNVNAALVGRDGNLYIFHNREYIVFPSSGINTDVIENKINQWADSQPNSTKWGRIRNRIAETGRVDAAFVDGGKTYLFSGDEYLVYSGNYDLADEGCPKSIRTNDQGFPAWDKIDAVFKGNDHKIYFFDNDAQDFVESGTLTERKPTRERWGIVRNNFNETGIVDSAYVNGNHLFLTSGNQFIRYTLADNNEPGEWVDEGYPRTFSLPGVTRIYAAFVYNDTTYLIGENRFLKFTKVGDDIFGKGKMVNGKLGALLEDMGFVHVPSTYYYLPVQGAYVYNKQLYIYALGQILLCSLEPKWIIPLPIYSNYFQLAYVNEAGVLQKVISSPYDAALVAGGKFYLFKGDEYSESDKIPETVNDISWKNPQKIASKWGISKIDAAFTLDDKVYLFSNDRYFKLEPPQELDNLTDFKYIQGNWGNLPYELRSGFDAALNRGDDLFFFKDNQYVKYENITDNKSVRPYEVADVKYEIIRLTTSTAYKLNQTLFVGGVPSLLSLSTQETDELPAFSTQVSTATTIRVKPEKVDEENLPISSHLDFNSANGIYYWEVFFHAPFLIAQHLNTSQKFEEAKEWYEYIFDPTDVPNYWQFLPFLAVDIAAIIDVGRHSLVQLRELGIDITAVETELNSVLSNLEPLVDVFQSRRKISESERDYLKSLNLATIQNNLQNLVPPADRGENEEFSQFVNQLNELTGLIEKLGYRYELRQTSEAEIQAYLNDPFDPHAIAALRTSAYQKAIVMAYIDNLIDWGDMLFRQYTRETINEARMLYILAYDLLGKKPENLGTRILSPSKSYSQLRDESDEYDFVVYPSEPSELAPHLGSQPIRIIPGTPNDSVANPYFFIPENPSLVEYWHRIEDRLYKIRHCLNIMGISQPLPLFQPPIDPMALVQAVSSGAGLSAALASLNIPVPHYRFSFMVYKAKELVQKLNQFGNDLLAALEKKDAEELSMLQNRQEGVILAMTRSIKAAQLGEAQETIKSLTASLNEAKNREIHYQNLIDVGLTPIEQAQIGLMIAASVAHFVSSGLKIAATFGNAAPDALVGPFIMGVKYGGSNIGESLNSAAEVAESLGEGLSVTGEVLGMYANHERMVEDWELQKKAAESDVIQLTAQLAGAKFQEKIAQREIEILEKEIEHNESIKTFMKDKFANAQLYQWMVSRLSGMYFQTYQMAYDMAKSAEKAFQFERGMKESEVNFINGLYWDNQKKGLLAGESLGLDLDRMEKAYIETDSRSFEISKNISLLELDPMALLQLKNKGVCEFALTEALFDYDFPGHYCRQIKTLSLTFDIGEGQTVMATLTQLNHKMVLEPDPKAVKYLLDPKDQPPLSIRNGWKANQQIALSHVDQYEKNNGLFELRFDDDRYLPFEGTGAVSTWRLELNGKKGSYNVQDILDVTINLKYTAEQGGTVFATAVKGMLKPYATWRFFDMTYDFPDEWNEFLEDDSEELVLRFSRDLFPNMSSSKILGIYTQYELYEPGQVSMTLNYDDKMSLKNGKLLATNGLSISNKGSDWVFTVKGNKDNLRNINLVLGYKASVT
ncbi:MAG: neuraminidase-like domain-containing protein [Coleofasciculus sp.]